MDFIKKLLLLLLLSPALFALTITPTIQTNDGSQLNTKNKTYFGEQLFEGNFKNNAQFHQNPEYILKVGDVISIKIWGAHEFIGDIPIDQEGNIFIPQVGTAHLLGLKSKDLQPELTSAMKGVFNDNVNVYATVQGYQPLSVFVSGSVNKVGLYDGFSTDSVLQFIDKAGGIIRGEGSYRHISILRNKKVIKHIDLYYFLLHGYTSNFHFKNGDVILINPVKSFVEVDGDVSRPYIFELSGKSASVKSIMRYVLPKPGVNRFIHTKRKGNSEISNDYALSQANHIRIKRGDKVNFFSNQYVKSISIAIEGEHKGSHYLSVPKGTSLYSVLTKVKFSALSNIKSTQIFRPSVAKIQRKLLETNLKDLETRALTSSSGSAEEASIRNKDAELVMKFIQRARDVEFKGQVVLSPKEDLRHTILEDGDKIYIPAKNNIITVQGEISIPNALTFKPGQNLDFYINACGGYTDRADKDKVLLIKANGEVIQHNAGGFHFASPHVEAGDAILVLGKTDTKSLQFAKDITQVLYQVAVGAAVVLNAF